MGPSVWLTETTKVGRQSNIYKINNTTENEKQKKQQINKNEALQNQQKLIFKKAEVIDYNPGQQHTEITVP